MKIIAELTLSENDAKTILSEVKNSEIIDTDNGMSTILLEVNDITLLELFFAGKKSTLSELIKQYKTES